MNRPLSLLSAILITASVFGQNPVDVGSNERTDATSLDPAAPTADAFVESFQPSDVGFLHIYVDPSVDPLETYLLRGVEMSTNSLTQLPDEFRGMAADSSRGTFYGALAVMGIEENLYLTRFAAPTRGQIDMFAVREGKVVHLKTLASLECAKPGNCAQMDSYLTDVNLDTTFDLIQISRKNAADTEGSRAAYVMPRTTKMWTETEELDVTWEGITFYAHPSAIRNH